MTKLKQQIWQVCKLAMKGLIKANGGLTMKIKGGGLNPKKGLYNSFYFDITFVQ